MKQSTFFSLFLTFLMPILAKSQTLFEWLERDSFLEISIQTNFSQLRNLKKERHWQAAFAEFLNEKGISERVEIEIRPGGVSRLEKCRQPPMKLRFPETFMAEKSLVGPRRLHLVAPCDRGEKNEQIVLRELVAYRLFNLVSDRSLHANLLKIKLLDQKGKVESASFAFLYEDAEGIATRLGGRRVRPKSVRPESLEAEDFDRLSLFEFMIGNTDWYPQNEHNLHLIGISSAERPVAVPYDFDYSGFVDAPYAVPHPSLPTKTVRERFYQGLCRDEAANARTAQFFLDRKAAFLNEIEGFEPFSAASRKACRGYLESFFAILEDPKKREKAIFSDCGKWFELAK